jgi:hypothetical protein
MTRARLMMLAALLVAAPAAARAEDTVSIGLYAPSAPFDGPVKRLDFVSSLAQHVGGKVGRQGVGRAYAKAGDFTAAVQRGELQFAVVDATYAAALGVPHRILAQAVRGGGTSSPWEVVTKGTAGGLLDLAGKTVAVPTVGSRDDAFLTEVLLEGELSKSHFGKVVQAPDALSALSAVEHGRVDAAFVPAGLPLPAGVRSVVTLSTIGWPVLVSLPGAPAQLASDVVKALSGFGGDSVFSGFQAAAGDSLAPLARRFARRDHRGPLARPALRLDLADLLAGRKFALPARPVTDYARAPSPPSPPSGK